jgi:hypothetical protein
MSRALLRRVAFVFVFAAVSLGGAARASAQDANALHLSGFFGLGVGGAWNPGSTSDMADEILGDFNDLDATVGFGVRLDVPVLEYLAVGGQIAFNFPKRHGLDDRQKWFDLPDLIVRGRYPVQLGRGVLEPYVGFLVGGTISITGENDARDTAYGWNVGVLLGAQYLFTERFGALFEIGWQRHAATHTVSFAGVDFDASYSANQAVMNFGFTTLF